MSKDKKSRRNPFTDCWAHARLSTSVSHCPFKKQPWKSAWLNEFNKHKQIDFVAGKK